MFNYFFPTPFAALRLSPRRTDLSAASEETAPVTSALAPHPLAPTLYSVLGPMAAVAEAFARNLHAEAQAPRKPH